MARLWHCSAFSSVSREGQALRKQVLSHAEGGLLAAPSTMGFAEGNGKKGAGGELAGVGAEGR